MSVQVIKKPFELALSDNPMIFNLKVNDLYDAANIYPSFTKTLNRLSKPGEGWGFSIIDPKTQQKIDFDFTAVPSPDDSGNFYHDNTVGLTIFDYIDLIITDFLKNKVLASFFNVVRDNLSIIFTAKQPIKELIQTDTTLRSILPGAPFTSTSVDPNYYQASRKNNYHLLVSIFFEDEYLSNEWRNVVVNKEIPNDNGEVIFDVSDILSHEFKAVLETPPLADINETDIQKSNLLRRYYISYSSSFEDKNTSSIWEVLDKQYVHLGGVSIEDFGNNNNIVNYLQAYKSFLTWGTKKKLHESQKDWLSFMNFTNSDDTFEVFIKVFFKDGTSDDPSVGTIELKKWESMIIPVGFTQRDIQSIAGIKSVFKWQIFVTNSQDETVSESQEYIYDCHHYECANTLTFLNAFYCPETILTIGQWEKRLTTNRSYGEKTLSHDYKNINGQMFQFDQESNHFYKVRSGYLDSKTAEYYQDVLINNNVFLTDVDYSPVVIKAKTVKIGECRTYLNQLEFDLDKSMKIKSYSEAKRVPLLTQIYNCGLEAYAVDNNTLDISTYGDLKLYSDGDLLDTVTYNPTLKQYVFTNKLIEDLNYKVEVDFTLGTGEIINYSKGFKILFEKAKISTNENVVFYFNMSVFENTEELFFDNGEAAPIQQFTIDTSFFFVLANFNTLGTKKVSMHTACPSTVSFFDIANQNVKNIDLTAFTNLIYLRISFTSLDNNGVDISTFHNLEQALISNTNYTSISVGLHKNIDVFGFNDNQLDSLEIERIIKVIWSYRANYKSTVKWIYLYGNPGAGANLTPLTLDIINGTGLYIGEGLQTQYNFNVIY